MKNTELASTIFAAADPGMNRKLYGLGLGFFRHRLAGGPFTWTEPHEGSRSLAEAVAKAVLD